jgi:hypothetical protein
MKLRNINRSTWGWVYNIKDEQQYIEKIKKRIKNNETLTKIKKRGKDVNLIMYYVKNIDPIPELLVAAAKTVINGTTPPNFTSIKDALIDAKDKAINVTKLRSETKQRVAKIEDTANNIIWAIGKKIEDAAITAAVGATPNEIKNIKEAIKLQLLRKRNIYPLLISNKATSLSFINKQNINYAITNTITAINGDLQQLLTDIKIAADANSVYIIYLYANNEDYVFTYKPSAVLNKKFTFKPSFYAEKRPKLINFTETAKDIKNTILKPLIP